MFLKDSEMRLFIFSFNVYHLAGYNPLSIDIQNGSHVPFPFTTLPVCKRFDRMPLNTHHQVIEDREKAVFVHTKFANIPRSSSDPQRRWYQAKAKLSSNGQVKSFFVVAVVQKVGVVCVRVIDAVV